MDADTKNGLNNLRALIKNNAPVESVRGAIRATLKDYVSSSCLYPKKIKVRDRLTFETREIYVPCGHCKYCNDKRIGEWSSRMIIHTLYHAKYCYFVTLTYRSFDNYNDIPKVLRDAYYRRDCLNYDNRLCYSPCLLRHEHVQRFMKYLRKIHGNDYISFFQGSEYGSDYGRPHHHLVIWSNEPISKSDIVKAWSCRLPGRKTVIHIGRVDYNDLNDNGTIVKIDGIDFGHDANRCFKYVAKYVAKSYLNDSLNVKSRVSLFIDDLVTGRISSDIINFIFNTRVRKSVDLLLAWADHFKDAVRSDELNEIIDESNRNIFFDKITALDKFKSESYENPFSFLHLQDEYFANGKLCEILVDWHPSINPSILYKVFRPYCLSSRSVGIGINYVQSHFDEYKKGNFVLPTYNGQKLLLPRAFVRKTKELLYRFELKTPKIVSKCCSSDILINKNVFDKFFVNDSDLDWLSYSHDKILPSVDFGISADINWFIRNGYSFRDYRDKSYNLAFIDPDRNISIFKYFYNRKTRNYEFIGSISYDVFLKQLADCYDLYLKFKNKFDVLTQQSIDDLDTFLSDMTCFVDSTFDCEFRDVLIQEYDNHITQLNEQFIKNKSRFTKSKQFLL